MEPTSSSPTTAEVSWQTCFWIIVTLALNTMAQPSGKVCGTPSHHRTYIRSSPVICAFDLVSIPIRLVFVSWKLKVSLRASLQLLLRRRFEDSDAKESANGTWLRWLLFVLGPLPQAIRLASFQGTPWTKVIGFTFLANFVVGEVLIQLESWEAFTDFTPLPSSAEREVNQSVELGESCLRWIGISFSFLPTLLVFKLGFYLDDNHVVKSRIGRHRDHSRVFLLLNLFSFTSAYFVSLYYLVFPFFLGIYLALLEMARLLARKHRNVVRSLMLAVPQSNADVVELDGDALFHFELLLLHLLYCFLGYRLLYDLSGTVNPGWTGVFG